MKFEADWRNDETQLTTGTGDRRDRKEEQVPGLTILAHPDPRRVGERLPLPVLNVGREVRLSRLEPVFKSSSHSDSRSLEDRSVSRRPIRLAAGSEPGSVKLDRTATPTTVVADGKRVEDRRLFPPDALDRGVVLLVGRRIALLLHRIPLRPFEEASFGLVGESSGIERVRREIRRLAALDMPVLLRGGSGTGKELVARALHQAGPRREAPFVAVNMAAVPPALAASELFGAARGAYTGAHRKKVGFFQSARGGTLFLDEIGEAPAEVQVLLLRALETGEIQPVGSVEPLAIDLRLIAATDLNLEAAIAEGSFRAPLLHRLAAYEIHLPALRERRDDIARLLVHFLSRELRAIGESGHLVEDRGPAWPPAKLVARLVRHSWPGNVRQLKNVARRLVIAPRGNSAAELEALVDKLRLDVAPAKPPVENPRVQKPGYRKAEDVGEAELLDALQTHRWRPQPTAEALGVSRGTLYRLIENCPRVRKASQLGREEIEAALAANGGDLLAAAAELEVSSQGLKRHMRALGLRD